MRWPAVNTVRGAAVRGAEAVGAAKAVGAAEVVVLGAATEVDSRLKFAVLKRDRHSQTGPCQVKAGQ
eukprot:1405915-Rhodomonas_salina.1